MSDIRIRRATIDDLPGLRGIWLSMRQPADELEKRLKEFQVVENGRHEVVGCIGIQISGQYALLHDEGFSDFSVADRARELFWERLQTLAANHGVFRVWTLENSPFWTRWGFQPADAETLARLPNPWKSLEGNWFTLELKDEDAVTAALQTKFAGFMTTEKEQTARISEQAKTLKTIITIVGFAIFGLCMCILVYWLMHGRLSLR